jgi:hypothetical protein
MLAQLVELADFSCYFLSKEFLRLLDSAPVITFPAISVSKVRDVSYLKVDPCNPPSTPADHSPRPHKINSASHIYLLYQHLFPPKSDSNYFEPATFLTTLKMAFPPPPTNAIDWNNIGFRVREGKLPTKLAPQFCH